MGLPDIACFELNSQFISGCDCHPRRNKHKIGNKKILKIFSVSLDKINLWAYVFIPTIKKVAGISIAFLKH